MKKKKLNELSVALTRIEKYTLRLSFVVKKAAGKEDSIKSFFLLAISENLGIQGEKSNEKRSLITTRDRTDGQYWFVAKHLIAF